MLNFKNVHIGFKETLFEIANLDLNSNSLYSLLGKNGIGKSTFFKTLLREIPLLKGEITLGNQELSLISKENLSKSIAFVPSRFNGVQHLSGKEFVLMGRAPYTNFLGQIRKEDYKLVEEIFSTLQIEHLYLKDTSKMSDGERQIISIAKAVAQESPIILLDEPTAFLDYNNKIKVISLLKEISKSKNKCIIQSSHDLEMCLDNSDELLVVNPKTRNLNKRNPLIYSKNDLIKEAFS